MKYLKLFIITCLTFSLLLFLGACKQQQVAPEDIPVYKMGETFEAKESKYTFEDVETYDYIGTKEASPGAYFLAITYREENLAKETRPAALFKFKLVDSEGRKFTHSTKARWHLHQTKYKNRTETQIHPGVPLDLVVVFEVPEDAKDFELELYYWWQVAAKVDLEN